MAAFTAAPAALAPGRAPVVVTLAGLGTAWTAGTTVALSGKPDASAGAPAVDVGAQTITVAITPGTLPGTILVTNSADAGSITIPVGLTAGRTPHWYAPRPRAR